MKSKLIGIFVCIFLIFNAVITVTGDIKNENLVKTPILLLEDIILPPPLSVDMILEESICRRMSWRSYTGESVTDEELSTILWAAYGVTEDGNRSIFNSKGTYPIVIYVIRSDATYTYDPENHSLLLFKAGNYLHLGQYDPAIKFGLVWDTDAESDELIAMGVVGMLAQNVYFDANALDLATITTALFAEELNELGLPSNHEPKIIMSLGHPSEPYDFTYDPLPEDNLPQVENNNLTLEEAINNRIIENSWDNVALPLFEQSQLLWCSYGYSYLWNNVNNKRHRTLPSAVAVYPFHIYAANENGVYLYSPSTHSISEIVTGDRREAINNSLEQHNIDIPSAPIVIVPCYNTNMGGAYDIGFWYYENGAIIHNILLEAAALNLSSNVIYDISSEGDLRSSLGIGSQTNLRPMSVVPVGNPYSSPNIPPEVPDIDGPTSGVTGTSYNFTFNSVDPDGDDVYFYIIWGDGYIEDWVGPYSSGEDFEIAHTYSQRKTYTIEAKARDVFGDESFIASHEITIPRFRYSTEFQQIILHICERFPILRLIISF